MIFAGKGFRRMISFCFHSGNKGIAYPRLARVKLNVPNLHCSFFPKLSFESVFKGFSGFYEACQRRVEAWWPSLLVE